MAVFLGLGLAGIVVLALSLVLDGVLDGLLHGPWAGLLSLPVAAGALSMFGFGAALVLGTTGLGTVGAVPAGVLAGTVTGWLTRRFDQALRRSRSAVTPRTEHLLGTVGTVVTAIPAGGFGEVLLRAGGQPVKFAARSAVPVERGAEVWVEAVSSSTSVTVRSVRP
ncbi:hypothetical protein ACIRBX_24600 [Kitasatospora sp. NPDC096147]|uniref:hypothetical protein n=1 Tax=Kitasatospora sp. NPDC096147 TaxID=3364093 RepID=UPI0038029F19